MYKNILIATDGSELARKALDTGMSLAKSLGAKVTVIFVTEPWSAAAVGEAAIAFPKDEYDRNAAAGAEQVLAVPRQAAAKLGVPCDTMHVKDRYPSEGIIETAQAKGCDLIVMASHGRRGFVKWLLGSQAHKVVTQGTIPILICR